MLYPLTFVLKGFIRHHCNIKFYCFFIIHDRHWHLFVKKSLKTSKDYILANRNIGPIATSLSAVSTCYSGFMFIGMIGFIYTKVFQPFGSLSHG